MSALGIPEIYTYETRAVAASVPEARTQLLKLMDVWGICPDRRYAGELVLSELTTNAIKARPEATYGYRFRRLDDGVLIEVWDISEDLPQERAAGLTATSGRGLTIVDSLATRWGVRPRLAGGKWVYAYV